MRVVLDTNVLVAAVLSSSGAPARILAAWIDGAFELVVSPRLLDELRRVLAYPKIEAYVDTDDADELLDLIVGSSVVADDPDEPPSVTSADPNDDFLITLAQSTRSILVSGDSDLLALSGRIPVASPAEFVAMFLKA